MRTSALADELLRLPLHPTAGTRLLLALDDDAAQIGELARIVETDPALSARVMQLANCAHYGLTRQVTSCAQAIMVVGFTMVRAVAVGAAAGLFADRDAPVPGRFWAHAAATAAGAHVVAERAGIATADAFSAGLLHDVGAALLHRRMGLAYGHLVEASETTGRPLAEVEERMIGLTHAWAGAAVLELWRFPPTFVRAVGAHHDDASAAHDLALAVQAGEALALRYDPQVPGHAGCPAAEEVLARAGIAADEVDALVLAMRDELDDLSFLLHW